MPDYRSRRGWDRGSFGYEGEGFMRGPSYRGLGPKNYHRSDDRIREEVCERLADDDRVDASDIEVHVQDSIVTLTGSVNDRDMKRRAEDVIEMVNGVRDVQNQIRVARRDERMESRPDSR